MQLDDNWNNCDHPPCGRVCHSGHPQCRSSRHSSDTVSRCNQHHCHSGNRCKQQHKNLNNSAANNGKKKSFMTNLCYCCCPCCGRRSGASKPYIQFDNQISQILLFISCKGSNSFMMFSAPLQLYHHLFSILTEHRPVCNCNINLCLYSCVLVVLNLHCKPYLSILKTR